MVEEEEEEKALEVHVNIEVSVFMKLLIGTPFGAS